MILNYEAPGCNPLDNKQNHPKHANQPLKYNSYSLQKQQQINLIYQLNHLQSNSKTQDNTKEILQNQKRKHFKEFIGGILLNRKAKDLEISKKEICHEHQQFKIFNRWKQITQHSLKTIAEIQIKRETQQFDLARKLFIFWKEMIERPKIEQLQLKRKVFAAFQLGCHLELSMRIRRMNMQAVIVRKRAESFISNLRKNMISNQISSRKAQRHWKIQKLSSIFDSLKKNINKQKCSEIRYKKYKLAHIFHRKTTLQRYFTQLIANKQ